VEAGELVRMLVQHGAEPPERRATLDRALEPLRQR
jgi:hypothetical protein